MFGLYLHFPFCLNKCSYCDFNSYAGKKELHHSYLNALKIEIRQAADSYKVPVISSLYFGGGTPTLFEADELIEVFLLCKQFFNLSRRAEVSIEANPETVNLSKLESLRKAGFNRISLGIQSLDDAVLKALGRIHNKKRALASYFWARQAGFRNINLDLIFGVDGQSIFSWQRTLHEAVGLSPKHISAYPLELNRASFSLKEADEDLQAGMYEFTHSFLASVGYEHYEISNFARSGFKCKHNLIYWQNGNYLGLGAGGHSHLGNLRFYNRDDPSAYIRKLVKGGSPVREIQKLTSKEILAETIFLGLRLFDGINLGGFRERFGLDLVKAFPSSIKQLLDQELILLTPQRLKLSRRGWLLANQVFLEFV